MLDRREALEQLLAGELSVEQYAKARHLDPQPVWHVCGKHRRWTTKPCTPPDELDALLRSCASGAWSTCPPKQVAAPQLCPPGYRPRLSRSVPA